MWSILFVGLVLIVNYNALGETIPTDIVLTLGERVDRLYGEGDATYCLIKDQNDVTIFEGFGPCRLKIDRVTRDHAGTWNAQIGRANKIVTEVRNINVRTEPPQRVEVDVQKVGYEIYIHCSVRSAYPLGSCKFRNPHSRVYLPAEGLVEDRYSFSGTGSTLEADNQYHIDCGLKIDAPLQEDLGLWRCAIETARDTHYGFATVLCPWAMMDPNVAAAVVAEPIVQADRKSVFVGAGEALSLACNIPATLDYCYFRSPSGIVYSLSPGVSTEEFEYAGTGFDAGECGITFRSALPTHNGQWTCNVGLTNETAPEQHSQTLVVVADPMMVRQQRLNSALVVVGEVRSGSSLDYCRYVRSDGLGFSSRLPIEGYVFEGSLAQGHCNLRVNNPGAADLGPWTVAARISGQRQETAGREQDLEDVDLIPPHLTPDSNAGWSAGRIAKCTIYALVVVALAGALAFVLIRQKNRNKVAGEFPGPRKSFRDSFFRKTIFKAEVIDVKDKEVKGTPETA